MCFYAIVLFLRQNPKTSLKLVWSSSELSGTQWWKARSNAAGTLTQHLSRQNGCWLVPRGLLTPQIELRIFADYWTMEVYRSAPVLPNIRTFPSIMIILWINYLMTHVATPTTEDAFRMGSGWGLGGGFGMICPTSATQQPPRKMGGRPITMAKVCGAHMIIGAFIQWKYGFLSLPNSPASFKSSEFRPYYFMFQQYPLSTTNLSQITLYAPADKAAGLLTIKITESPRRNILLTYLSLFIDWPFFRPLPPLENSVHISLTSSNSLNYCIACEIK